MIEIHPNLKNFVRPSAHSKYSPSSAERWWYDACSASLRLSEGVATEESKYAKEGTLAHSLSEAKFLNQMFFQPIDPMIYMQIAAFEKEQGREVLAEMNAHAEDCAGIYFEWLRATHIIGDVLWFGVERGVPVFPEKDCYGTGDFIIIGTKAAVVIDFKYGVGKVVPASSLQLRVYLAGIFRHLRNIPQDYKFISVVFQPRVDASPGVAEFTPSQINQDLNDCWKSIIASEDRSALPRIGSYCFFCPANRPIDPNKRCPAKQKVALEAAALPFQEYLKDLTAPVDNPLAKNTRRDQAIVKLLSIKTFLNDTIKELEEEVQARILGGEIFEGVELVDVPGNRAFAYSEEQVETAIKKAYPQVEVFKTERKLRGISDLEKEIGQKDILTPLTQRKVSKQLRVIEDKQREMIQKLIQMA